MKQYYECHITLAIDSMDYVAGKDEEKAVEETGWTYSKIDGDPDLGGGVKGYATRQFNINKPLQEVLDELDAISRKLQHSGVKVIREKVEQVIYDRRIKR